jgi:hypothetical protein
MSNQGEFSANGKEFLGIVSDLLQKVNGLITKLTSMNKPSLNNSNKNIKGQIIYGIGELTQKINATIKKFETKVRSYRGPYNAQNLIQYLKNNKMNFDPSKGFPPIMMMNTIIEQLGRKLTGVLGAAKEAMRTNTQNIQAVNAANAAKQLESAALQNHKLATTIATQTGPNSMLQETSTTLKAARINSRNAMQGLNRSTSININGLKKLSNRLETLKKQVEGPSQ